MIEAQSAAATQRAPVLKYADAPFAGLETEEGTFAGYASLFHRVDLGQDKVSPAAFAASLKRRGAKGVRMLWQHDPNEVIGSWLDIREDQTGLFVRGRINTSVARGREVLSLIRDGAVDGLSIGFKTVRASHDKATGVRTIREADLWEISIVTFPMLPEARVSEVKGDTSNNRTGELPMLAALIRKAAHSLHPKGR
ncbi:MAG: HK97 family phage prohead protease [Rhizobiaceae bacterium]|jgi:hypothetical protein|nr:HK97 family phage prohead protease [Rhizobiaceae bacterium]